MPFHFQSPLDVVKDFEQPSEFSVCSLTLNSLADKISQPTGREQETTARLGTGRSLTFQIIFKKLQCSQKLGYSLLFGWVFFQIRWKPG